MYRPWIAIALVSKIIHTISSIYHTEITYWCKGLTCGKFIYTNIIEASMINTNDNHAIIKNRCGKKPMESRYPEISMVRCIYSFILR